MAELLEAMADAERKAWDALSRYKFLMSSATTPRSG